MSEIVEPIVLETRKGFNHKRFKELLENPPKELYYNNDPFHVDPDVFRVLCEYIYNLVHKNLDILFLNGGEEGTGKSTDASQIGQQFYYIMIECNVLRHDLGTFYEYNEKNCLAHNLISFLKKCDKFNDDLFHLIICDEAGGLKSEERWDEWNKKFRDDMRKDRKKLRIKILCYPQPFELVKDFTLARVNSIRISEFRQGKEGEGLIPDMVKHIIIPRGKYTFSCHTKELIPKKEIKQALLEQTKERYTKELNNKYIFKTCRKDKTFCFNVKDYIKNAKEENRLFLNEEKIFLSSTLIKIFAEYLTPGKIGLSRNKKIDLKLPLEERQELEKERKFGLLINKLVMKCRDSAKNLE